MERPIITAKVENLKRAGWITIYADGWRIASIWGRGEVKYVGDDPDIGATYLIDIGGAFLWVDVIKREVVEPIKQEAVNVGV